MNRQQRRALARYEARVKRFFQPIVDCFVDHLFNDRFCTYKDLFDFYNYHWKQACEFWNTHKAKFYKMDEYWFYNNYKPVEGIAPR